ncbi:O-antigen ligase family protein [Trinickia sp. NRRL B-1857]|uniref:O-antigen ligase family protein n=1 Tax=Trinickia sp. NRRL B-1857 TaxID=3162879 RepID=UPI003D284EF2
MIPSKTFETGSWRVGEALTAVFVLAYPFVTLAVRGGASAMMMTALALSLSALMLRRSAPGTARVDEDPFDPLVKFMCIALAGPLCATLASELWHGRFVLNLLDAPWRFLAAVPILLALRRMPLRALQWSDCSFAIGAIGALAVAYVWPFNESTRLRLPFLDSIHYGDIALVMGLLSGLSIDWWRKDRLSIRLLKVVGLLAGLAASVLSGSRGGWLALPVIVPLVVYVYGREKSRSWRIAVLLAMFFALIAVCAVSREVQHRLFDIWSDIVQYSHGHKDTSTGLRLQLYSAAISLTWHHPLFGAGPNGFANAMPAFERSGAITPAAAAVGYGEAHNQLLADTANYGMIAGLAGIAVHFMPGWLFARHLKARSHAVRGAAVLGLTFVVSFFVFGLTVETFDLKMVVSFYASIVAILAGIVISPAASRATRFGNPSSINGA